MRRNITIVWLLLGVTACTQRPIPTPTLSRDLSVRPHHEAPTIPLSEVPLETQADFDALEEQATTAAGLETLVATLRALAEGADPKERPSDALLLMRLALVELRSGLGSDRLQRAFAIAETLRTRAPESPHGAYLIAEITRILLRPGSDHAFEIDARTADIAQRLHDHLASLLKLAPQYDGPWNRDGELLREEHASLGAAIATYTTTRQKPPPQAPSLETTAKRMEDALVVARRELSRHEQGTDVDRVTLCRDQVVDGFPAPEHAAGQWLILRCAATLGLAEQGYGALAQLSKGPEALSSAQACAWAARLPQDDPQHRIALNSTLEAGGQPACAPQ